MLVRQPWSASGLPCAAWAVGGRVVRCRGSCASGGTSRWRSRKVVGAVSLCRVYRDLVSCGRRGGLDVGRWRRVAQLFWRVGFFIFVGASRVCSSQSTHGVFSPALVGGRLILVG
jgi:hypothetical protein